MDRIEIGSTYGYTNFITQQEQLGLLEWVDKHQSLFKNNGNGRKFGIIQLIQHKSFDLVDELKHRIIELENLKNFKKEPIFQDYIGINSEGAAIHVHTDPNEPPYVHTRYNIVLSYPERGGESLYGTDINILQERLVWKCIAGKVMHGSTPVVGNKPRITLSLGFLINDK